MPSPSRSAHRETGPRLILSLPAPPSAPGASPALTRRRARQLRPAGHQTPAAAQHFPAGGCRGRRAPARGERRPGGALHVVWLPRSPPGRAPRAAAPRRARRRARPHRAPRVCLRVLVACLRPGSDSRQYGAAPLKILPRLRFDENSTQLAGDDPACRAAVRSPRGAGAQQD